MLFSFEKSFVFLNMLGYLARTNAKTVSLNCSKKPSQHVSRALQEIFVVCTVGLYISHMLRTIRAELIFLWVTHVDAGFS